METGAALPDTEAKLRYLESTLAPAGVGEPVRRLDRHLSHVSFPALFGNAFHPRYFPEFAHGNRRCASDSASMI